MDALRLLFAGSEPGALGDFERLLQGAKCEFPDLGLSCAIAAEFLRDAAKAPEALLFSSLPYDIAIVSSPDAPALISQAKGCGALVLALSDSPTLALEAIKAGAWDACDAKGLLAALDSAARRALIRRTAGAAAEQRSRRDALPFAAMAAHELKSPLNAVEGYLSMMDAAEAGGELAAYSKMLKRSLARVEGMKELVSDIMELARSESGRNPERAEELDPKALCERILESLSQEAASKGVSLELAHAAPISFKADPRDLETILANLISNAIKYNRKSGRVEISLSIIQDTLSIKVADTGIGMEPGEAARVSAEFLRIRNADTREIPGSGLGLSIVKRLAALYGGELKIESERGKGSVFTATLKSL